MNRFRWRSALAIAVAAIMAIGGAVAPAAASGNASSAAASSPCGAAPTGPVVGFAPGNKLVVFQDAAGCITFNGGVRYKYRSSQYIQVEVTSQYVLADSQMLQPKTGVSFTTIDAKLAAGDIRWFTGDRDLGTPVNVSFFGGLGTSGSPDKPSKISFQRTLTAGTYYFAQMRPDDAIQPSTTARAFVVEGTSTPTYSPLVQRLNVTNVNPKTNWADSFSVWNSVFGADIKKIQTNALVTASNTTGGIARVSQKELHFFKWTQVLPGTTSEQVCASYHGGPSRFVLVNGQQVTQTFGTLSPGKYTDYLLTVPANARYWVSSEIPDGDTGIQHMREFVINSDTPGAPLVCEGVMVDVVAQLVPSSASSRLNYSLAG